MTTYLIRFCDGIERKVRATGLSAAIVIAQHRRMTAQKGFISHAETRIDAKACEVVRKDAAK
jgi:hypothetical protein